MTVLAIAVATALVNFLVAELFGWLPWLAERIIECAARLLPPDVQYRYYNEWCAELDVLPGRGISAIIFALRILVRARRVRRELDRRPVTRPSWTTRPFTGALQWALEGSGWAALRLTVDFFLLCGVLVIVLGGVHRAVHVSGGPAPLLALPPLVVLLLYLRGLYSRRLRVLVISGLVTVVSAVSLAAMAVAVLGMLLNNQIPGQTEWLRAWILSLLAVGLGRTVLFYARRWARVRRVVGMPVLIVGAGVVGVQVARGLETHPEYGLVPIGFVDDDPRPLADVGGRDVPVLGNVEDLEEVVARTGVTSLIVAFSSMADEQVSRVIQRCDEMGVEVSVVPRMFDTINDRAVYNNTVVGLPLLSVAAVAPRGLQLAIRHVFTRVFASRVDKAK